jgi:hypothetical protein
MGLHWRMDLAVQGKLDSRMLMYIPVPLVDLMYILATGIALKTNTVCRSCDMRLPTILCMQSALGFGITRVIILIISKNETKIIGTWTYRYDNAKKSSAKHQQ